MDLIDLSIDTGFTEETKDISPVIRKAATMCMPGLITDTLANKAVDINEAIRFYWLNQISKMKPEEVMALLKKYALNDPESAACIKQLEARIEA